MSPAAVLAILITVGQSQSPVVKAMFGAASDVVGAGAVRLVEVRQLSDAEALQLETSLAARATVQLDWLDAGRQHARLRLHAARTDRWIDRDLAFAAEDTPTERGRTLGFAIASMLPEGDPSLQFERPAEPPAPPSMRRYAAGLAATGTMGLGGAASGWGAVATVERFFGETLSLDVALAGRLGHIDELDARELATSAGVGGAWWPVAPTETRGWGLALRVEALLLYHAVSHQRVGGAVHWKGDLLPGADVKLEGTYLVRRGLELVAGGGAEIAFGTIDVTVTPAPSGEGTATIPALRALAEVGIRARF
jgi:hypothetical protein